MSFVDFLDDWMDDWAGWILGDGETDGAEDAGASTVTSSSGNSVSSAFNAAIANVTQANKGAKTSTGPVTQGKSFGEGDPTGQLATSSGGDLVIQLLSSTASVWYETEEDGFKNNAYERDDCTWDHAQHVFGQMNDGTTLGSYHGINVYLHVWPANESSDRYKGSAESIVENLLEDGVPSLYSAEVALPTDHSKYNEVRVPVPANGYYIIGLSKHEGSGGVISFAANTAWTNIDNDGSTILAAMGNTMSTYLGGDLAMYGSRFYGKQNFASASRRVLYTGGDLVVQVGRPHYRVAVEFPFKIEDGGVDFANWVGNKVSGLLDSLFSW